MRFTTFLTIYFLVALGLTGMIQGQTQAVSPVSVGTLRCEFLENPLGLDAKQPRLTWIASSNRRGDKQTAYQVLVASTADILGKDQGDIWDSGKVGSAETAVILDKPLVSRQACYWKVRVWDADGNPSAWSDMDTWEMGLLNPEDWKAQWIDAPRVKQDDADASPIEITHADFKGVDGGGSRDVTDIVSKMVKDGTLLTSVSSDKLGGDPANGHVKELVVTYTQGGVEQTITAGEGSILNLNEDGKALPYLRKTFVLKMPVVKARLYATALGLYELHLNGKRVGNHIFAPDWTDYRTRVRYQEYDVTSLLHEGANALAGLVGNGWYCGHIGNGGYQAYGEVPALLAQLEVTYRDGSVETIVTDGTWKMHPSPLLSSDIMLGENYDAQRSISGWDQPTLNDSDWSAVAIRAEEHRNLDAQVDQPVVETEEINAKSLTEPAPDHWVYDLGQNMVGVVRIKVSAPAGTKVTLHHAEVLDSNHMLYTDNLRGAPSVDTYICNGDGTEIWQPRFTFHGFRYVELTGLPDKPDDDAVTGIVLGSGIPRAGHFECSNPVLNQLYSNIIWGQRGNYLSIPTDCPQRDERLGWMGDAQVFVRTATCNFDVAAFFSKWLVDVDDAQHPDGGFTDVSPAPGGAQSTPAWGDAGVICPWTIYQAYGDKRILERHLPAMIKWVEYCRAHSTNLIRDKDRGGDYGDWLAIGADTPKDLIATAYFAYSTHLVAQACQVVGQTDEATKYQQLFQDIKAAFNERYVKPDGHIEGDTQCDYAMALKFELLPDNVRSQVAGYLADDIRAKGDHLSTGFLGVGYLLPTLTQGGQLDTAYRLLLQDTYPSWLFSVKLGATTIWERWDGWTPAGGFQTPIMNSFNHYSLGSCGQWFYQTMLGIDLDPEAVGYANVVIHPQPGGGLSWAKGSIETVHGLITTSWTLDDQTFTLDCTIPMNATATVILPTADTQAIRENNSPLAGIKDIVPQTKHVADGQTTLSVGSGSFHFTCPL
jgi:hypothetical protein